MAQRQAMNVESLDFLPEYEEDKIQTFDSLDFLPEYDEEQIQTFDSLDFLPEYEEESKAVVAPEKRQIQPVDQGDALSASELVAPKVVSQIEPKVEPVLTEPKVEPVLTDEKIEREPVNIIEAPLVTDGYSLKDLKEKGLWQEHVRSLKALAMQGYSRGEGQKPDADGNTRMTNRLLSESVFDSLPLEQRKAHIEALSKQKYDPSRVVSESGQLGGNFGTPSRDLERTDANLASRISTMEVYDESALRPRTREVTPGQLDVIGFDTSAEPRLLDRPKVDVGEAGAKALESTTRYFKNIPNLTQAQIESTVVGNDRLALELYEFIDQGGNVRDFVQKTMLARKSVEEESPELAEKRKTVPYGPRSGRAPMMGETAGLSDKEEYINLIGREYADGSPAKRAQLRVAASSRIEKNMATLRELQPKIEKYFKLQSETREGIPKLSDAKNINDVINTLTFYTASGLETVLPIVVAGAAAKRPGAIGAALPINFSANVSQRFNHLMQVFQGLETTEEKAEAMVKYLDATRDDTLRAAITDSFLDSFLGPVGQAVKGKLLKPAAVGVKGKAKEIVKSGVQEGTTEALQEINQIATAIKLREKKGPVFTKQNIMDAAEMWVAGAATASVFKGIELGTGQAIRNGYEAYKDSRVKGVIDSIFEKLHPKEQEFIRAQENEGTSPSDSLELVQLNWGQNKDPVRVMDPDGNEFANATGAENAIDITEFVNEDRKLVQETEDGVYNEQESTDIANRAWVLIDQEGMSGAAAFKQAKDELQANRTLEEDMAKQEEDRLAKQNLNPPPGGAKTLDEIAAELEAEEMSPPEDGETMSIDEIVADMDARRAAEQVSANEAESSEDVEATDPENIPTPSEDRQQAVNNVIDADTEYEKNSGGPNSTDFGQYSLIDLWRRVNLLQDVRNQSNDRKVLFENIHRIPAKAWKPVLPSLPTRDLHRLFKRNTRGVLDFTNGVDEDHIENIFQGVRDISAEQGQIIRKYAPLIDLWSDFNKKSRVTTLDRMGGTKLQQSRAIQLAKIMNYATRIGIDPTRQSLEAALTPTVDADTGEVLTDPTLIKLLTEQRAAVANPQITDATISSINKDIAQRKQDITQLYDQWKDLMDSPYGQQAREIFNRTRDAYLDIANTYEGVLIDNIKGLNLKAADELDLVRRIQERWTEMRQSIPLYFQLGRRGDYYISIPKALGRRGGRALKGYKEPGTRGTIFLDSETEMKDLLTFIGEQFDVDLTNSNEITSGYTKDIDFQKELGSSDGLIRNIFEAIDDADLGANTTEYKNKLKESVGQIWLQTLPSSNIKMMMGARRKGTYGEGYEALSNFADTLKSVANQLPRVRNGNKLRRQVTAARAQVQNLPKQLKLDLIIDEIEKRVNLEMSPPNSAAMRIVGGLNKLTYAYLLSLPKSAMIQLIQFPLVMAPTLNAFFAKDVGYFEVKRTVLDYLRLPSKLGVLNTLFDASSGTFKLPSVIESDYLNGTGPGSFYYRMLKEAGAWNVNAESEAKQAQMFMKEAWMAADRAGLFSQTFASDIGGLEEIGGVYKSGLIPGLNRGKEAAFKFLTGLFNVMERINREISFMAASELAYKQARNRGLVGPERFETAIANAFEATREGAIDFTSFNKPRLMRETAAGVSILQFANYSINMNSIITRNSYRFLSLLDKSYTPRERVQALETVLNVQVGTILTSGVKNPYGAIILTPLIIGGMIALVKALSDKDEEYQKRMAGRKNRLEELRKIRDEYNRWFALPDKLRMKLKRPRMLTSAEDLELIKLDAADTANVWREAMKKHPLYNGWRKFFNWRTYARDITIPELVGTNGLATNYFNLGEDTAATIRRLFNSGVPSIYGADISRNTSLNNLFLSELPDDPDPSFVDMGNNLLQSFNLLPSSSTLQYIYKVGKNAYDRNVFKTLQALPKGFSAPSQQIYLDQFGAVDYEGMPLKDYGPMYYTAGKLSLGGLGFSDQDVAELQQFNFTKRQFIQVVNKDRQDIINKYKKAVQNIWVEKQGRLPKINVKRNLQEFTEVVQEIGNFDVIYSKLPEITPIRRSLKKIYDAKQQKAFVKFVTNGVLDTSEKNAAQAIAELQHAKQALPFLFSEKLQKETEQEFELLQRKISLRHKDQVVKRRKELNKKIEELDETSTEIEFDDILEDE